MGCLNSNNGFEHWFGNIHLSGPCNRSCYFCIGQHMMSLDAENNLNSWPLPGLDEFINRCLDRGVNEINLTGTNTDPLLFEKMVELRNVLEASIPNLTLGLRTNGVLFCQKPDVIKLFQKGSVTICSLDEEIYRAMMGQGRPPDIKAIVKMAKDLGWSEIKANVVLGPENVKQDVFRTIDALFLAGFDKVNLREPYGQSHIGDPIARVGIRPDDYVLGMPTYFYGYPTMPITYWDVHYVHVESVNLYASGHVSETYPITKGHDPKTGIVLDQSNFSHGRHQEQWVTLKKKPCTNETSS